MKKKILTVVVSLFGGLLAGLVFSEAITANWLVTLLTTAVTFLIVGGWLVALSFTSWDVIRQGLYQRRNNHRDDEPK